MPKLRKVRLALAAAVACLSLPLGGGFGATHAHAQHELEIWSQVAGVIPGTADLTSVFMLDTQNAWVAGYEGHEGRAYRISMQGPRWGMVATYSLRAPVRGISAVADNNVWAVGDSGLIAHKGDGDWQEIPNPVQGANLSTIQMLGNGEEGWAGGTLATGDPDAPFKTVLLHYTHGQWQDSSPQGLHGGITSLHLSSGGGYAAIGDTLVLRYSDNDAEWTTENLPAAERACNGSSTTLAGVRAISASDAWVVGTLRYFCNVPYPASALAFHRLNGRWESVSQSQIVGGPTRQGFYETALNGISFTPDGYGLAVGWQRDGLAVPPGPYIISYQGDGYWHYEQTPCLPGAQLSAISQADASHALAVGALGTVLAFGYGGAGPQPCASPTGLPAATPTITPTATPLPTHRVEDPHDPGVLYFPVVGHTIRDSFRDYWQVHGGLEQFGYPLTEEFLEQSPTDDKTYTVQYFERARFESHPENRPPYDVLLGLLGRTITGGRETEQAFKSAMALATPGNIYFPATGHNMPAQFAGYWQAHGGLPVYGYPISEAFNEVSPTDGKTYLVQYFERNRFEYHPELPETYRVSLGLLGVQVLKDRGWLPGVLAAEGKTREWKSALHLGLGAAPQFSPFIAKVGY